MKYLALSKKLNDFLYSKQKGLTEQIEDFVIYELEEPKKKISIYKRIPEFISENTKSKIEEIFNHLLDCDTKRPMRKSIIFACIYLGCLMCNEAISLKELLEFIPLKYSQIRKSINDVSLILPKTENFKFFLKQNLFIFESTYNEFNYKDVTQKLILFLDKETYLFNNSRPTSIISSCIIFSYHINNEKISFKDFSSKVNISQVTLKKKFKIIQEIILRRFLFDILLNLIKCCKKTKSDVSSKLENSLMEKTNEFFIKDEKLLNYNEEIIPHEKIKKLEEWNYLLNTSYLDNNFNEYKLCIILNEKVNKYIFKLKDFEIINAINIDALNIINYTIKKCILNS